MATCVLIVHDEPAVRALATDILSDAGFETMAAEDANQALHLLENDANNVDVLFTDVRMPGGMSGLDLARVASVTGPVFASSSPQLISAVIFPQPNFCANRGRLPSWFRASPKPLPERGAFLAIISPLTGARER